MIALFIAFIYITPVFGESQNSESKIYTWTDKIYIRIAAPDFNFDSFLIDEIGNNADNPVKVSTRGFSLDQYKLTETGPSTGIFTGEVILTGFCHDADGDSTTGFRSSGKCPAGSDTNPITGDSNGNNRLGLGPTNGFLQADDDDGITISFELSEDVTIVSSALVRWSIGEVHWLETSYSSSGTGVVRVVDPDMNLNPEAIDNFSVDVWSDSDTGGIDLTVTETSVESGVFEGTVFFTASGESSGNRLRVSEGNTVTVEYDDNTLPRPYTVADELDIQATSIIGTVVSSVERISVTDVRTVNVSDKTSINSTVDQQIQITANLTNNQNIEQSFVYLLQIQNGNDVPVYLTWITGSLNAGQSFSPAISWNPDASGEYTATVFVWESIANSAVLSSPVSIPINII